MKKIDLSKANLTKERALSYLMSESSLAKDWLTEEEDESWEDL